jgi:hypothetical protein
VADLRPPMSLNRNLPVSNLLAGALNRRTRADSGRAATPKPGVSAVPGVPGRPGCLGEQWGEALHPPVEGHVVDVDAAFGEEFLQVAVGEAVAQVPATASRITSGGNRNPANADGTGTTRRAPPSSTNSANGVDGAQRNRP